jgi:hypothetical protein
MDGYGEGCFATVINNQYSWMFKRAKGFFDVVAYTGDGIAGRTVNHNLGVVPEMMWVKSRSNIQNWPVYANSVGNTGYLLLNETNPSVTGTLGNWNNTSPTTTVFTVGSDNRTNASAYTYIAYLFATLAGYLK